MTWMCTQKLYHGNCARSDTSHLSASDKFTWCVVSIFSIHLSTIFAKFGSELNNSKLYHCTPVLYSTPKPYQRIPYHSTVPRPKTIPQNSLTYCIYQKKEVFFRRVGSVPILSTLPYHCTVPYPKTALQNRTPKTVPQNRTPKPYPKTVPWKTVPENRTQIRTYIDIPFWVYQC